MTTERKQLWVAAAAGAVTTLLVIGILAVAAFYYVTANQEIVQKQLVSFFGMTNVQNPSPSISNVSSLGTPGDLSVVDTVKRANPSVVAITISKNVPVYERYLERVPSPFGDDFFGGMAIPRLRQQGTELQEVGGGSGFLVSADGYIVTNSHVVSDETAEYTVFTNDGTKHTAKVIARDPSMDIAVIKIEGSDFPSLTFGDSDKVEIGQTVIAIGNALAEFRNTVSVGVVSGLSRSIVAANERGNAESLDQLIQTDAGINPGNSGGPLLNLSGEVIGVNVAMANGAENIGFALNANGVKSIVESVKKTGRIVRPYIGIRYVPITPAMKERNSLPTDYGLLVLRGQESGDLAVIPGSPADKAGIVENDILLEADGKKLMEDVSFSSLVRSKQIGDRMSFKIFSKGKEKTVTVILEEMPGLR